jgi:hypothetical protein
MHRISTYTCQHEGRRFLTGEGELRTGRCASIKDADLLVPTGHKKCAGYLPAHFFS